MILYLPIFLMIISSVLLSVGLIFIILYRSNNIGDSEATLSNFSSQPVEFIAGEDRLAFPLPIIDFPKDTKEKEKEIPSN